MTPPSNAGGEGREVLARLNPRNIRTNVEVGVFWVLPVFVFGTAIVLLIDRLFRMLLA